MAPKEYFDLLAVVPLEEEVEQVLEAFQLIEDRCTATQLRYVLGDGSSPLRALLVQQEAMGKTNANKAATTALEEFDAGLVVCLGIAGSLSTDAQLGHVCYTGTVIDVYDNAKTTDTKDGALDIQFSPAHYQTQREITAAINFSRLLPGAKEKYLEWQSAQGSFAAELVGGRIVGADGAEESLTPPTARPGLLICGAVSDSKAYNEKLLDLDRKSLAVETESGGIFEAAISHRRPALTIRGISDYALNKGGLEAATKGAVRRIAARNAATFLRLQLGNERLAKVLNDNRAQPDDPARGMTSVGGLKADDPSTIVARVGQEIDDRLRDLCPEFRLQPKGYRLPVPRVGQVDLGTGIEEESEIDPIQVREALAERGSLLVTIPRTYPDNSLPWVLADDLLSAEIAGKQVIPIVVDGGKIAPPRNGLSRVASNLSISKNHLAEVLQYVFIVENIPVTSRTKLNFLLEEMRQWPGAKFVFMFRGDSNILLESDFRASVSADMFVVCDIPFIEIAHFIQKNFSMTDSEAEVVALRLRNTFHAFDLSIHPTYFAGIPRETLTALLQANRRAELIQLAVDGFLTFVVADDKADVALSRTTRARFLRLLAVALRVEKRSFTQEQLIIFTREFAREYDFDIDPMEFLQAFVAKGIIHFEDDQVRFSLPFIESYLLARELTEQPDDALRYFRPDDSDFDLAAFDFYAELGPSAALSGEVTKKLEIWADEFEPPEGRLHVLLTDEVRPSLLGRPDRMNALRRSVRRAIEDVNKGTGNGERKQQTLDIADKVKQLASKSAQAESKRAKNEGSKSDQRLGTAVQAWVTGTVLLGSGAEHMTSDVKRRLASLLVTLGARIIDEWTRVHVAVNFEEIKKELTGEEALRSLLKGDGDQEHKKQLKALVAMLADVLEYTFLAEPLRRTIGYLSEQARHRVLATSVENAKVSGTLEGVILGAWLTDIDSRRGSKALRTAIKGVPPAPFFRVGLAAHFLQRVYWNHWHKDDRIALLDAAEEALKPIDMKFDKPRLKRLIEKSERESPAS
jgi:nucleoside phosphorylase